MTLRRDFLSMTAGAVAARTVLPAVARNPEHPDAALITACTEFVELELRLCATFNREDTAEEEDAGEAERDAIRALQGPLQDIVEQTPARTLDGLRSKARALVAWDETAIDENAFCTHDIIQGSLLRDLVDADDPAMWAGRTTA